MRYGWRCGGRMGRMWMIGIGGGGGSGRGYSSGYRGYLRGGLMLVRKPTEGQLIRAQAIVEYVRAGPFDLAKQVQRLAEIAEIAVAMLLAEREKGVSPSI